jgi:hypothetical protein
MVAAMRPFGPDDLDTVEALLREVAAVVRGPAGQAGQGDQSA